MRPPPPTQQCWPLPNKTTTTPDIHNPCFSSHILAAPSLLSSSSFLPAVVSRALRAVQILCVLADGERFLVLVLVTSEASLGECYYHSNYCFSPYLLAWGQLQESENKCAENRYPIRDLDPSGILQYILWRLWQSLWETVSLCQQRPTPNSKIVSDTTCFFFLIYFFPFHVECKGYVNVAGKDFCVCVCDTRRRCVMLSPFNLPQGILLLITDELSAPADFLLHRGLHQHLKENNNINRAKSKATILSVSEGLTRWKAVASRSVSVVVPMSSGCVFCFFFLFFFDVISLEYESRQLWLTRVCRCSLACSSNSSSKKSESGSSVGRAEACF